MYAYNPAVARIRRDFDELSRGAQVEGFWLPSYLKRIYSATKTRRFEIYHNSLYLFLKNAFSFFNLETIFILYLCVFVSLWQHE
jgi:hypothetical protein